MQGMTRRGTEALGEEEMGCGPPDACSQKQLGERSDSCWLWHVTGFQEAEN